MIETVKIRALKYYKNGSLPDGALIMKRGEVREVLTQTYQQIRNDDRLAVELV